MRPPPLATRVQQLGEVVVAVVGGFCEFNDVVHDFVERAAREVVLREGGEVGEVRRRFRRLLARGAWKDWHRAIVARMQMGDPSPSQATDLMERRRRADGEAAARMAAVKERKRDELAKGYKSRLAAGSGGAGARAPGAGRARAAPCLRRSRPRASRLRAARPPQFHLILVRKHSTQ